MNTSGKASQEHGNTPKYECANWTRWEGCTITDTDSPEFIRYLDEMSGIALQEERTNIAPFNYQAKERMGYATQKILALLERIIKASSNEGGVVPDPFCGRATTLEVAHNLNRRWIGINIASQAIKRVARIRLHDRLGSE